MGWFNKLIFHINIFRLFLFYFKKCPCLVDKWCGIPNIRNKNWRNIQQEEIKNVSKGQRAEEGRGRKTMTEQRREGDKRTGAQHIVPWEITPRDPVWTRRISRVRQILPTALGCPYIPHSIFALCPIQMRWPLTQISWCWLLLSGTVPPRGPQENWGHQRVHPGTPGKGG